MVEVGSLKFRPHLPPRHQKKTEKVLTGTTGARDTIDTTPTIGYGEGMQVSIYVDAGVWEAAKEKAWEERVSVSRKVGEFLKEWAGGGAVHAEAAVSKSQVPAQVVRKGRSRRKGEAVPVKLSVQVGVPWQKAR